MNESREAGFRWFAQDNIMRQRVELMASKDLPDNPNKCVIMYPMTMEVVEVGQAITEIQGPTMSLKRDEARQLCAELCRLGYGPDDQQDYSLVVEAQKENIRDLRQVGGMLGDMMHKLIDANFGSG